MTMPQGIVNKSKSGKKPEIEVFTNDTYYVAVGL